MINYIPNNIFYPELDNYTLADHFYLKGYNTTQLYSHATQTDNIKLPKNLKNKNHRLLQSIAARPVAGPAGRASGGSAAHVPNHGPDDAQSGKRAPAPDAADHPAAHTQSHATSIPHAAALVLHATAAATTTAATTAATATASSGLSVRACLEPGQIWLLLVIEERK